MKLSDIMFRELNINDVQKLINEEQVYQENASEYEEIEQPDLSDIKATLLSFNEDNYLIDKMAEREIVGVACLYRQKAQKP